MFCIVVTVAYVWFHATSAASTAYNIKCCAAHQKCWTAHNWAEAHYWTQCYSITGFLIGVKFRVFFGQLWCKIHWILQAWATNTILYDCMYITVLLFLYNERIQNRSTTVVWLTGVQGGEPSPWQVNEKTESPFSLQKTKCKNWAPIFQTFFWMMARDPLRWSVGLFQLRYPPWLKPLATQLVYNLLFLNHFLLAYTKQAYNQRGFSKRYLHNSQLTKANADNEAIHNDIAFGSDWL